MITVLDYGMGNLGSIVNMFNHIGFQACIVSDPHALKSAKKLVLPGVGAFDSAMSCINGVPGLRDILDHKALVEKIPILGVCLGMQLLTSSSEEGQLPGLNWIQGVTTRIPNINGLKVPHMGWNTANPNVINRLTSNIGSSPRYYFVHSYCVHVDESDHSLMTTNYGVDFDSAICCENIYGVQFHPEKSHRYGMDLLNNFAELPC